MRAATVHRERRPRRDRRLAYRLDFFVETEDFVVRALGAAVDTSGTKAVIEKMATNSTQKWDRKRQSFIDEPPFGF
jgi:hypothetical protein